MAAVLWLIKRACYILTHPVLLLTEDGSKKLIFVKLSKIDISEIEHSRTPNKVFLKANFLFYQTVLPKMANFEN